MPSCAWQEDGVVAMQHLQVSHRLNTTAEHVYSTVCTFDAVCVCVSVHTFVWRP